MNKPRKALVEQRQETIDTTEQSLAIARILEFEALVDLETSETSQEAKKWRREAKNAHNVVRFMAMSHKLVQQCHQASELGPGPAHQHAPEQLVPEPQSSDWLPPQPEFDQ